MKTILVLLAFVIFLPISSARQTNSQGFSSVQDFSSVTDYCPNSMEDNFNRGKYRGLLTALDKDEDDKKPRASKRGTGHR